MTMMATMDGRGVDLRVCQIREDRDGLGSLSISNDLMGALTFVRGVSMAIKAIVYDIVSLAPKVEVDYRKHHSLLAIRYVRSLECRNTPGYV